MEGLTIKGSATTPFIDFNAVTGKMVISGRSIPEQPKSFWSPILAWFFAYSTSPAPKTEIILDMEYFNNASAKQLMFLFSSINKMFESGFAVNITWIYELNDIEMKELGHDFASLLSFDIQIKVKSEGLALSL
jgi:hypothetical protein